MNPMPDARREKEIFEHALDLPSARERQRYVQQASGEDRVLLARVGELLQAFDEAQDFLMEHPTGPGATVTLEVGFSGEAPGGEAAVEQQSGVPTKTTGLSPLTEKVGDTLGVYRLLNKIGEGGCGTVYVAEQLRPLRRRVALKVVKLGMDTRQVIARFEAERQVLALMDHPHIARVFDAGCTDTGRPYFVMELVQGVRITQFCNERRLSLRERLELFAQVCSAIQHAHQKGIIHRDIKPSNILVSWNDGVPVPKVIDFGIAKAAAGSLTEQTLFTKLEQFLGTPAYMSPEQAGVREVDIDTRSDIYSLGVVLYELLTGQTPFDGKALLQQGIEQLILTLREVEPPCPSRCLSSLASADLAKVAQSQRAEVSGLVRAVRGDLDCIVTKCLEKDRSRRYGTANGLAMDIQRHLDNEPVVARPPTYAYRLRKLLLRNKVSFAIAGLISLALLGWLSTVIFLKHRANQHYRQRFYAYQMHRAGSALTVGQYDHLKAVLAECPLEYRHWEWHYLNRQLDSWSEHEILKIGWPIRRLLVSHDSQLLALLVDKEGSGESGKVQVHELGSGRWLSTIEMEMSMWTPLTWDSNGGLLAGIPITNRGIVQIWNARTGDLRKSIKHEGPVECLAFSPHGRLLVVGSKARVNCWEIGSWALHQPALTIGNATALAFSRDGRQLAVGNNRGEIHFLDVASGMSSAIFSAGKGTIQSLAFSPDVERLVSVLYLHDFQRGMLKLWDLTTGSCKDLGDAPLLRADFSPDGARIMCGEANLWDATSGQSLGRLPASRALGDATVFHPHGGILTGRPNGEVVLNTLNQPAFEQLRGHRASLRIVRFSPNGQTLASAGLEPEVHLWDVATARRRTTYAGHRTEVVAAAWSVDGRSLVSAGSELELHCWDPTTLKVRWTNSLSFIDAENAWWLEFSPNGKWILSSSSDGVVGLWDARTGASLRRGTVTAQSIMDGATWSPDSTRIAGLLKDWVVMLTTDGLQEQWKVAASPDRCVRFSPDGLWIAHANSDGSIGLRSASDGQLIRNLERHQAPAKSVVFSPDGRRLFSGGADGVIRIWDTSTGDEVLELNAGGNASIWSIDLSRDGNTLAAADSDGVVTLWKTATAPTP